MNFNFFIQESLTAVLFFIFNLFMCIPLHAQSKSVTDTVDYIIKKSKNQNHACDELNALGKYFIDVNELDNAQLVANKCKELAEKNNYEKGIYDAYSVLGSIGVQQNDDTKARSASLECLKLAVKNNSDYGVHGANYLLVKILYKQGEMDSVISVSRKILETALVVYDSVYLPKFNTILGNVYYKKGDFRNANKYYLNALTIAEKTSNEQLQSACIGNLAIINKELKNYREALKYHNKALALRIKNNQLHDVAGTYSNIATSYSSINMQDSAIFFYKKALELFNQLNSIENIALVNNNLGQLMVDMNQLDSGMYHLKLAKRQFILLHDTINMANNAWAMGNAWRVIAVIKNNKSYLSNALTEMLTGKTFAEIKSMEDFKMNCYKSLSVIYEAMCNEPQAFLYLKKFNLINDSIRSQAYTNQIAEMQTKYETEKKENEITKLNSEKLLDAEKIARQQTVNFSLIVIAVLILISGFLIFRNVQKKRTAEKQVAILEKQNAIENMRSKIASDVHDDMGANLTRLGLNAQQLLISADVPEKEKQLAEKMSLQSKEIITGMREIIWASNPANDNLKGMLGFMRQYIDRFFDGTNIRPVVNFPHDIGEITLHPEVRRNLFLILKESLNNAIKYSGTDKMDIDFANENEHFNFNIKDYGKGMDDKNKDDFSNGLHNMQIRAQQIQSLFKLTTAPGKGVQISVEGKLY